MKPPTGVETWLLDRVFGGGEGGRAGGREGACCWLLAAFEVKHMSDTVGWYTCVGDDAGVRGLWKTACDAAGLWPSAEQLTPPSCPHPHVPPMPALFSLLHCSNTPPTSTLCLPTAGKMSRDVAISETAAAMLAWFESQLSTSPAAAATTNANNGTSGRSPTALQAAAGAAHIPLAAVGLNAAAAAVQGGVATSPRGAAEGGLPAEAEGQQDLAEVSVDERAAFAQRVQASFKEWLTTPLAQQEVEFTVKGG